MSVLVKGMKMPKGCHSGCPLTDNDAFTCQITGKDIVFYDEDTITSRPSWCPLVEVPTHHGELIDRNVIRDNLMHEMFGTGYQSKAMKVCDELYTPTVIKAEE